MDGQLSNKIIKDWVHLLILTYSCKKSRVTSNSSFSFFHMPSILPQSNPSTVKTFLLPAHILPPWLLKLFLSALLISSHLNHYNSSKCSPDFNFWGGGDGGTILIFISYPWAWQILKHATMNFKKEENCRNCGTEVEMWNGDYQRST